MHELQSHHRTLGHFLLSCAHQHFSSQPSLWQSAQEKHRWLRQCHQPHRLCAKLAKSKDTNSSFHVPMVLRSLQISHRKRRQSIWYLLQWAERVNHSAYRILKIASILHLAQQKEYQDQLQSHQLEISYWDKDLPSDLSPADNQRKILQAKGSRCLLFLEIFGWASP